MGKSDLRCKKNGRSVVNGSSGICQYADLHLITHRSWGAKRSTSRSEMAASLSVSEPPGTRPANGNVG
jgi:hypothetical protein